MRHGKGYKRLGRDEAKRKSLLRNLATSLVLNENIHTTLTKAKQIRPIVEKLITLGIRGDLHARRLVNSYLFDKKAVAKLFGPLATNCGKRPGGYTRILKTGVRLSDGARLALIEFVDRTTGNTEATEKPAKKATKAAATKAEPAKKASKKAKTTEE